MEYPAVEWHDRRRWPKDIVLDGYHLSGCRTVVWQDSSGRTDWIGIE
jgi:hypothetical protein